MKKIISIAAFAVFFFACASRPNQQSSSLFNGKDLTGWHLDVPEMDSNTNAKNPFIVRNGMLVSLGKPGGHLITDSDYKNYRLKVEYRFAGTVISSTMHQKSPAF